MPHLQTTHGSSHALAMHQDKKRGLRDAIGRKQPLDVHLILDNETAVAIVHVVSSDVEVGANVRYLGSVKVYLAVAAEATFRKMVMTPQARRMRVVPIRRSKTCRYLAQEAVTMPRAGLAHHVRQRCLDSRGPEECDRRAPFIGGIVGESLIPVDARCHRKC